MLAAPESRIPTAIVPETLPAEVLEGEGLLQAEVYSCERLEQHARDLAQWHRVEHHPGGSPLLARLSENALVLDQVLALLRKAASAGKPAVPAGEWLLDNDYQVREHIALVRRHLPRGYSRELPRLTVGDPIGLPRVYALALELIAHADGRVDNDSLNRFIAAYQQHATLALGELWAVAEDHVLAERISHEAVALGQRLDHHAWDGAWYLRAWFDDGQPLGTKDASECRIDALPQAWAARSGVTDPYRTRQALASVDALLVRANDGLIQLFDPPFGTTRDDSATSLQPGYIKGYVPGVRENGGQYTHAAVWIAMAHAALGDGDRALTLARMINPVHHARDAAGCARWRGEPYVMAADVYRSPGHVGQAGWTWYTGSADWMWRLLVESLLGLHLRDGTSLEFLPTTPATFGDFTVTYHHGDATYQISVQGSGPVRRLVVDGTTIAGNQMPLNRTKAHHQVRVKREPSGPS